MTTGIFLLAAIGLGALISIQPPINAHIAAKIGDPLTAAVCSIAISLAMVAVAWVATGRAGLHWFKLPTLPWWALLGGAAGALFVFVGVMIAPKLGVATFFACVVLGQLLGAAVVDHLGAFGMEQNAVSWPRALGLGLVFAGAVLTRR